jgi:hypothetical protein
MTYVSLIGLESQEQAKILREVCLSIWSIMRPECIPKHTKEQWELTALEFEKNHLFPALLRGRRWETYSSKQTGTQWLDVP